jgi:hypothetical protein
MADMTVGRVSLGPANGPDLKVTADKFLVRSAKPVRWEPKPDITTYELARAMPLLVMAASSAWLAYVDDHVKALPDEVKRHFVIG